MRPYVLSGGAVRLGVTPYRSGRATHCLLAYANEAEQVDEGDNPYLDKQYPPLGIRHIT